MERIRNLKEQASKVFNMQSLIGENREGIEKKIRFKKDEISFHQNHINHLELEIAELEKKLNKI